MVDPWPSLVLIAGMLPFATALEKTGGVALIVVDSEGQNAICVASGANYAVTPADINAPLSVNIKAGGTVSGAALDVSSASSVINVDGGMIM